MTMKINDISGKVFGRLVVISDSMKRAKSGDVIWSCLCSCGNKTDVIATNLKHKKTKSCGCLAKELSSQRAKELFTKSKTKCSIDGCFSDTSKGGNGYCGKHAQRNRRYGDPMYITPENVRAMKSRMAQLENKEAQKNTYKKFYGKHEHRIIGEQIAGRKLKSDEHVHHINGDKHNNHPSNLMILSAKDHAKLHAKEKKNAS
jgi:hypothetical protein